jgi:hypothetical protein
MQADVGFNIDVGVFITGEIASSTSRESLKAA